MENIDLIDSFYDHIKQNAQNWQIYKRVITVKWSYTNIYYLFRKRYDLQKKNWNFANGIDMFSNV
jgi:hypothetical protein